MSTAARKMTVEEFLALPDDGVERWLIDGEVYEFDQDDESREHGMTIRNEVHAYLTARFAQLIGNWCDQQKAPRGKVVCGEAGVRFSANSATAVGVDVAYISPETLAGRTDHSTLIVEAPVLVVEVISPSDTQKNVAKKIKTYLKGGVRRVWVVDPDFQAVMVHRPGATPFMVGRDGELTAEPELAGLRIELAQVFE